MLKTIQAGRALAALAVVSFHAALYCGAVPLADYGFLGVDFFFVLSGFIIYWVHRADHNLREYVRARALRIFVPYLPISIGIGLLAIAVPGLKPGGVSWDWLPTLTLLPVGGETALGVAWTLRHELVFYSLFGAAMIVRRPLLFALLWPLAIAIAAVAGVTDRFVLAPINVEFSLGIFAAWAVPIQALRSRWLTVAGLALLPVALALADPATPSRILFGVAVALLLGPLVRAELAGKLTAPAVLVLLGNASYAIYLAHNPVITLVGRLGMPTSVGFPLAIVLGVGAGLVYHLAWERPALRLLRTKREIAEPHRAIPSVRLISHASVIIEAGSSRILTDPWFSGKAFNESWSLLAEPAAVDFSSVDYLWLSHEHPDHFHLPTLSALPTSFKERVTVLFQKSSDHHKIIAALRHLGFSNLLLLPHRRWVRLNGAEVLCYQSRQIDSALAVRSPGGVVLNINDCDLSTSDLRKLRRLVGPPDVLLNQFSLAGFDGIESELAALSARILDDMVRAHRVLGAKVTVPFASFAFFCCDDNAFLNQYANSPRMAAARFAAEELELKALRPGQALAERGDALGWWDQSFASLDERIETAEDSPTLAHIETAFADRCRTLKRWHGIWRRALRPIVIECWGLGRLQLDFGRGKITQTSLPAVATIAPQPLLHMLANDFGFQTLGVSGRYRLRRRGLNWTLHRALFSMINAGVGLSLAKLLAPQQLAFFWARRSDLVRQVVYTLKRG